MERLKGSGVDVCAVVGFPLGATLPQIKALEATQCILEGAKEIDMVINVGESFFVFIPPFLSSSSSSR